MAELNYKSEGNELARMQSFDIKGATKELQEAQKLLEQYKSESRSIKIAIGDVIKIVAQTSIADALTKILAQYELKKQELYQRLEESKSEQSGIRITDDEKITNVSLKNSERNSKIQRRIKGIWKTTGRYRNNTNHEGDQIEQDEELIYSEDLDQRDSINVSSGDYFSIQERSSIVFGKGTIEFIENDEVGSDVQNDSNTREIVENRYQKTRGNVIQSVRRNISSLMAMFNKNDSIQGNENRELEDNKELI